MKLRHAIMVLAVAFALVPARAQPIDPRTVTAKTYEREPTGKGDPAAITCRHPQALQGSRLMGPEVCRSNADWAQFAKQGMVVSPDGLALLPSEKARSLNPAACGPTAGSAPTTSAMGASRGGMTC